jgi:spore germination protein YaaH
VLAAIVVGVLVIGFILVSRACGSAGCDKLYCESGKNLTVPEGYERVTAIYTYNDKKGTVGAGKELQVSLPIEKAPPANAELSFFRYVLQTGGWEPLSPAIVDAQSKLASGTIKPGNTTITVLRRLSPGGRVVAYLPHNAQLHPDAGSRVTVLHTFDFRPASDGAILGDPTDIKVTGAKSDGSVAHYPSILGDKDDKQFIPIITGILDSAPARSNHVQRIVKLVVDKQLSGIDIAYLDLPANQRTSFSLFIFELGQALKAQNKALTVTIPSPIRTQDRVDEGAYDWAEISKSADFVKLWPLRDQSTYRKDMPVILEQLAREVQPPTKIIFTVSPYSSEKSAEGVQRLTFSQAMVNAAKMAVSGGADQKVTTGTIVDVVAVNIDTTKGRSGITWSPETASVSYTYEQGGGRTVWVENTFSVGFKLEFIARFKLGGVAIEDASGNTNLADTWPALIPFISTGQPLLVQPNPGDLVPKWKVSKGTQEGGDRGVLKWATPSEPGTYTITLSVSDGVSLFENEISWSVQAKERPAGTPQASPTAGR